MWKRLIVAAARLRGTLITSRALRELARAEALSSSAAPDRCPECGSESRLWRVEGVNGAPCTDSGRWHC